MLRDFGWALEQMRQGLRVTRWVWRQQCIRMCGTMILMFFDEDDRGVEWTPSGQDVTARDWRVELLPGEGVQECLPLIWR